MVEQALDDLGSWVLGWPSMVPLNRLVRILEPLRTAAVSGIDAAFTVIYTSDLPPSAPPEL